MVKFKWTSFDNRLLSNSVKISHKYTILTNVQYFCHISSKHHFSPQKVVFGAKHSIFFYFFGAFNAEPGLFGRVGRPLLSRPPLLMATLVYVNFIIRCTRALSLIPSKLQLQHQASWLSKQFRGKSLRWRDGRK